MVIFPLCGNVITRHRLLNEVDRSRMIDRHFTEITGNRGWISAEWPHEFL